MSFLVYWTLCNPAPLLTWPLYAWVFPSSPPQILKIYFYRRTCFNLFWGIFTALQSTLVNWMISIWPHPSWFSCCVLGIWWRVWHSTFMVLFHQPFFPGGSDSKESTCKAGDLGLIPGLGRSPGKEHGNPLQYSCLESPMDRGAHQAIVHRVAKSQTRLSN